MNLGKKNLFKKIAVFFLVPAMFIIAGCMMTGCAVSEDTDVYQYVKEHTTELQDISGQAKEKGTRSLAQMIFAASDKLKSTAPLIIIGSVLIGLLLLFLFHNEQSMRKHAIFVFILGIPIVDLLLVYGTAWLAGWFL